MKIVSIVAIGIVLLSGTVEAKPNRCDQPSYAKHRSKRCRSLNLDQPVLAISDYNNGRVVLYSARVHHRDASDHHAGNSRQRLWRNGERHRGEYELRGTTGMD